MARVGVGRVRRGGVPRAAAAAPPREVSGGRGSGGRGASRGLGASREDSVARAVIVALRGRPHGYVVADERQGGGVDAPTGRPRRLAPRVDSRGGMSPRTSGGEERRSGGPPPRAVRRGGAVDAHPRERGWPFARITERPRRSSPYADDRAGMSSRTSAREGEGGVDAATGRPRRLATRERPRGVSPRTSGGKGRGSRGLPPRTRPVGRPQGDVTVAAAWISAPIVRPLVCVATDERCGGEGRGS